MDREKVITAIEKCINLDDACNSCDYDGCIFKHGSCEKDLLADVLAVLKDQEEVDAEIEGGGSSWWYVCGDCHGAIDSSDRYCRHCGRRIKQK